MNEGYSFEGFTPLTDDFTPTEGVPTLPLVEDAGYYDRLGIGPDAEFDLPLSAERMLDAYYALPATDQKRLLRGAFWLRHADQVWDLSHTAYYLAVINAVEVMLPDHEGERCPTCGMMMGPGPTARFEAFLDTWAPKADETEESRKVLYRARSKLAHGRALLRSDVPQGWGALVPAEADERDRSGKARRLAQVAIINWLLARGAENG